MPGSGDEHFLGSSFKCNVGRAITGSIGGLIALSFGKRGGGRTSDGGHEDNTAGDYRRALDDDGDWLLDGERANDDENENAGLRWLLDAKGASPGSDLSVTTRSAVPGLVELPSTLSTCRRAAVKPPMCRRAVDPPIEPTLDLEPPGRQPAVTDPIDDV